MNASLHCWRMVKAGSIVIAMLIIILVVPFGAIGQDKKSGGGNHPPAVQEQLEQIQERFHEDGAQKTSPTLDPVMSGVDLNSLDGEYTIYEHDQMWNRNPNPNPEWDFRLYEQGEPAGDINGDGIDDFVVTDTLVGKTAVFFGGNSQEPDDIVGRELVPVGDLNGDGYADAVAVDDPEINTVEIYEGTTTGYSPTGATISDPGLMPDSYEILGFVDFNQDGLDDIYAYSQTSSNLKVALGDEDFNAITVNENPEKLSFSFKKVVAKDVDQDNRIELVEFSGGNGDGQVNIWRFVDSVFGQILSFGFNPPFNNASNTDLHLLDANGDGYDDIYISLGRNSPKYVLEYNDEAEVPFSFVEASNVEIWDGELVPAGDLDGDDSHDFIIGDPYNSNAPYIAYGSEDLSSNISLDVPLEGDNGANWSWEMDYNPYSRFGDLNGDGIDDVLLSHTEYIENSINYGRRIVFGSEGLSSDNSQFQLYPSEYFYSRIYEVEELGDTNEDGIDDFAVIRANEGKIEIYHGGSSISQSPDQIFNSGITIDAVASGDFTGDGISDLAVLSWEWNYSQFEVFEGGESFNKVKSVAFSEFIENASNLWPSGINNIGDFSGNGSDDFIIGSGIARDTVAGEYLNEAYIFYGGSSISSSPDSTIDLDKSGDFGNRQIFPAASAAPLGDIDGDGMGDFAVGSPTKPVGDILGELKVFLSGSESPLSLTPDGFPTFFGWDIAIGDFNGDEENDIAVSAIISHSTPPKMVHIYYGGDDFDETADQSLSIPDFESGNGDTDSTIAELEVISDFNNDGKDELLVGTSGVYNNHAALFSFHGMENDVQVSLVKGANATAGLGGNNLYGVGGIASGDFTGNGELDVLMTQPNDNNDAFQSSRVYRYALSLPLAITSVEDVPEDQGGEVRVNISGELLESSHYDSLGVQRLMQDNEWETLVTDNDPGASSYDVPVPETQPTDNEEVDKSYTFRVVAFTDTVLAKSQEATGRALDNIPPPQVQSLVLEEQEELKILNWQEVDAPDIGTYLIFNTDEDGQLSEIPTDSTDGNSFTLSDHFEGVQTFAVSALDVNNNEGKASAHVNAIYPQTAEYATAEGWSLIGLPVDAEADSIESLLQAPDLTIYEYDGGYQQVSQLESGKGYWAKFTETDIRTLEGLPFTEFSIELEEGWNLISGVGGDVPVESAEDPDEIIIPGTMYTFDQAYLASDTLRPAMGYWIRTNAAGTVTFKHPNLIQDRSESNDKTENSLAKKSEEIIKKFNKVVISEGSNSTELFFGSQLPQEVSKLRFSLPPLPPGDFFDARYEGDTRLVEKNEAIIQFNKRGKKPLTLQVKPPDMAEQERFVVKEFADGELRAEYKIGASEEVSLKHKSTDTIYLAQVGNSALSQQGIPEKFDLEQNYPNPFNPTTQIQYSVPEATEVKLEIFNILGRRVRTLVNEQKEPGNYEVTFDGSNLASGIYLYRLQAGDFITTKKFILAK